MSSGRVEQNAAVPPSRGTPRNRDAGGARRMGRVLQLNLTRGQGHRTYPGALPAFRTGSSRFALRSRRGVSTPAVSHTSQGDCSDTIGSLTLMSVQPLANPPEGASNAPDGLMQRQIEARFFWPMVWRRLVPQLLERQRVADLKSSWSELLRYLQLLGLIVLVRWFVVLPFRFLQMLGPIVMVRCFQDKSLLVRSSTGVRQGDPVSPILFNLVADDFLAEHCKKQIAFVSATDSGDLNVSGMAFADDLIIFASIPAGLQDKLLSLQVFRRKRGLSLNSSKCLSLAMIPAGKKLVKIDPTVKFYVNNEAIPAAVGEREWRYLGISFSARMTRPRPVHHELKADLENIRKAALKPQQRLVVLRFYLLPRLYHSLILGPVSRQHLMRLESRSGHRSGIG
ncbi:hypothetical protein MRX96_050845 [Rhipicephalus microplus]